VTVTNAAPTVDAGPDRTVQEGDTLGFEATVHDPGNDVIEFTWSWGDGTPSQTGTVSAGTAPGSHVYADDGTYTAAVCVTDDDGGTGCDSLMVTVTPDSGDTDCTVAGLGRIHPTQPKGFAFLVHYPSGAPRPAGTVVYADVWAARFLNSLEIQRLTCAPGRADLAGTARVNGVTVSFMVHVVDGGPNGTGDRFEIRWPGYEGAGALTAGDVAVRIP
jgi:hypothetical protein